MYLSFLERTRQIYGASFSLHICVFRTSGGVESTSNFSIKYILFYLFSTDKGLNLHQEEARLVITAHGAKSLDSYGNYYCDNDMVCGNYRSMVMLSDYEHAGKSNDQTSI